MKKYVYRLITAALALVVSSSSLKAQISTLGVAASSPAYGIVIYSDAWPNDSWGDDEGMYRIPTDGASTDIQLVSRMASVAQLEIMGATLVGDKYYVLGYQEMMGYMLTYVLKFDPETWELLDVVDTGMDITLMATDIAYDPITQKTYGCFYSDTEGYTFATIDFDAAMPVTHPIAHLDDLWNGCAIDAFGTVYALTRDGKLYTVNKDNGEMTLVGDTGVNTYYTGSAAIDQRTGAMYWNVNPQTGSSYIYQINTATAEAALLYQCANNEEIVGMYVPAPAAADDAPAAVADMQANFDGGEQSGSITFTAPATTFAGDALSGSLEYTVLVNGAVYQKGSVNAGDQVMVPFIAPEAGNYRFIAYVSNAAGDGPKTSVGLWIGYDTPQEPENVILDYEAKGEEEVTFYLSWDPVTKSVNHGFLGEVTYTVTRYTNLTAEGEVCATGLKDCIYESTEPYPQNLTAYWYTVQAVAGGVAAQPVKSDVICLGTAAAPFSVDFSDTSTIDSFTVVDVNDDWITWMPNDGDIRIRYNQNEDMDDWLITPGIRLEGGKQYEFYFYAKCYLDGFPERVEAAWGKAPTAEAMTEIIVPPTDLTVPEYQRLSGRMIPDGDGVYYFGIHGISDRDQFYLQIKSLGVGEGTSVDAPAAPTDMQVTPNSNGRLLAEVMFTAPTTTIGGSPLSSLDKIEVLCDGKVSRTFTSVAPGETYRCQVSVSSDGMHTVSAVAYNEVGAGNEAKVSAYFGVPEPLAPEKATVVETDKLGEVTITWTPVTKGVKGKAISSDHITYAIVGTEGIVESGLKECSYTYQAVPEGQDFVYYGIAAVTDGGESEYTLTDMIAVGVPFVLPVEESFVDGWLTYPMGTDISGGASWNIYNNRYFSEITDSDETNGFAGMSGQYVGSYGDLFTGKIILDSDAPLLTFDYFVLAENDTNELHILVNEVGKQPVMVASILQNDGEVGLWTSAAVSLAQFAGKEVQVTFRGDIQAYAWIFIDNIKIAEPKDYDLALTKITAPAKVEPDSDFTVDVMVKNIGLKSVDNYSVQLYCNGDKVGEVPCGALDPGKADACSFDCRLGVDAPEDNVYRAVVVCAPDQNPGNNEAEIATILVFPNYPTPTDLRGELTNDGVQLQWDAPDMTSLPKMAETEDFESFPAFDIDNFSPWTTVDVDQGTIGAYWGVKFPNQVFDETRLAYFIINADDPQIKDNESFMAHSGVQYLSNMYNYNYERQSDWLISPMLTGEYQTITFYAKSYSYAESIAMHYSMTDTEISSFVKVAAVEGLSDQWEAYTFDVPKGALYFAIECTSKAKFMLFIDDITYIPADGKDMELNLIGYNVYRDGVKINDAPVTDTSFVDASGTAGDSYLVTAVYAEGESAPCAPLVIDPASIADIDSGVEIKVEDHTIVITGATSPVALYTIDGKTIYTSSASPLHRIPVSPGIYLITTSTLRHKLLVK